MTALRHKYPILRRARFLTAEYNEDLGVKDVTWINANGSEMHAGDWNDDSMKCFGMLMDGRAQVTGIRRQAQDATLLLLINSYAEMVDFDLPECPGGKRWTRLVDTNAPDDDRQPGFEFADTYQVTGRSLLLFRWSPTNPETVKGE